MADDFALPEGAKAVRASSLTTWQDCPRRWMAQHRGRLLANLGYELRTKEGHIGAHVGSAAHTGIGYTWAEFTAKGELPLIEDSVDRALTTLRERMQGEGVMFDDTTPNVTDAHGAVLKMIRTYRGFMATDAKALMIEEAMAGRVSGDWFLTGHCDAYIEQGATLRLDDLKTGVSMPAPAAQLGSYVWLGRSRGMKPKVATVTFLRRTRRNAEQPPPLVRHIEPALAEKVARTTLLDIRTKVQAFEDSREADPSTIPCNPQSHLCSRKFCQAYHTAWCRDSLLKE